MPLKIPTIQTGLEQSIRKAVKNVSARGGLNLNINSNNFSRPLGKITGSISEFNKSLEASNARVLAFGASVGIIQSVQRAFASLLSTTIEVEKQMTEINVVMGLTNAQLDNFQKGLFNVAKNTAQSFSTVATAATELARQGLSVEETLKRTNDALILTRLTGLDAANAVSGLTAALNTFNDAGLDSTQILSKMAAVDVQFAVSTEDLIDAVSRAGAVAQDAGVSFDELLGAVTAAQQQTARGGKVIGNSFKTIFTRVQRSSTISRLEELGIAVRDLQGNTLPAIAVLQNLAKTYDTLADTTKAAVAEQVGGVFQINILKAAIKDLANENSILARATQISSQATDEAYKKNEILNRSLAALTAQASTSLKEFTEAVGSIAFEDNMRGLLGFLNDQLSSITNFLNQSQGESMGADFFKGVIKGIGNVISGPGLILTLSVLGKLFVKTFSFLAGSGKELLGVVSAAQQQKKIQESIVAVLAENSGLQKRILSQEGNRAAQEKTILSILQAQSAEQAKIAAAARAISPGIAKAGYGPSLTKIKSGGHVPNYVSAEERLAEKKGARAGGYTPGAVKSMSLKGEGRVVYNSAETVKKFPGMEQAAIMPPKSSSAGKKYKKSFSEVHGFDPYANEGLIPNYSLRTVARLQDSATYARGKLNSSQSRSQGKLKDFILRRAKLSPEAREFEPPKFDLTMARDGKSVGSLDNPTASRARAAVITSDGKTHLGFWHDDIRDDLARRKIDLKGAKDLELLWANKGFIPNYSAFHHQPNLFSNLPEIYTNAEGKPATTISAMKALDFIDFKGLQRIMEKFVTHATADGMSWKGSYSNMPIQDYKKHFGDQFNPNQDQSRGISQISDKRMSEILKNPSVTKSFFRYITGREASIDISPGLTPEEKLNFEKQYGSVPKIKHIEDGASSYVKGRQAQLSSLVGDFLEAGAKGNKRNINEMADESSEAKPRAGSVREQIYNNFKATRFGKQDSQKRNRLENLIKENAELDPELKTRFGSLQIEEDSPSLRQFREREEMRKRARSQIGGMLAPFYPYYLKPKTPESPASGTELKSGDKIINDRGQVKSYVKFGDFQTHQLIKAEKEAVEKFGPGLGMQNILASSQTNLKGALRGNESASILRANRAFQEFEELINDSKNPISIKDAESQVRDSLSPDKDVKAISSSREQRMKNMFARDDLSVLEDQKRKRKALDLRREFKIPTFQDLLEEDKNKNQKRQTFLDKMFFRFRRRPPSLRSLLGSEGIIPNFMNRRTGLTLGASSIKPFAKKQARIRTDDYDGTIGLSQLDRLLTQGTFKSIDYTSSKGNNLIYTNARWGVNQYKKGAPPPGNYVSYGDMDKSTGTRALWVGSTGEGAEAFRRLRLENVNSIVAGGKHFRIDPDLANQGMIPNFSGLASMISKYNFKKQMKAALKADGKDPSTYRPSSKALDLQLIHSSKEVSQAVKDVLSNKYTTNEARNFLRLKNPDLALEFDKITKGPNSTHFRNQLKLNEDLASMGMVPNYMNMLGFKELFSKAGGAAKSLITTPFKDAGALIKGGYKGVMGVEHMLRSGLKGTYKGLEFGEKMIRGGLGKGFDFMKNFPRTTLYGGGGGLAYAFRDMLPMIGGKISGGFSQLIDLIAANPATAGSLLGALGVTGTMGAGMLAEALQAGKLDKIKSGLLGKGKHRANTLIKDLPPDLQKEALKRMKPRGGPNSFVPKSILEELGMASGFVPNFAKRSRAVYSAENPTNIARALVYGQRRALNLDMGQGRLLKDLWHSSKPALATGTELDSIRTLIYKNVLSKSSPTFIRQVEQALGNFGRQVPAVWGERGKGLIDGMLVDLNLKRAQARGLKAVSDLPRGRELGPADPFMGGAMSGGLVPNFASMSSSAKNILEKNPSCASAAQDAIAREASFGLTPKLVSAPSLKSKTNPGLAVVNQEQEKGMLSNARKLHGGLNPKQKSSAVPNYAISGGEILRMRRSTVQQVSAEGLTAIQKSFQQARSAIDSFSASTRKGKDFLDRIAKSYATNSNLLKEANLREKARLGTLKLESKENQQFARQMFRKDALENIANKGGPLGKVAGNILQAGPDMEKELLNQMAIARKDGNQEMLKSLKRIDATMDMSAKGLRDLPRMQARAIESALLKDQRDNRREERYRGREGFKKEDAKAFFAQQYLGEKGIATSSKGEAKSIIANLGKAGQKEYTQYLQNQGVLSSNRSLARGGLLSGQFANLTGGNDGKTFIRGLGKLETALKSGNKQEAKRLEQMLMRSATRIGKDVDSSKTLQGVVSATKQAVREESRQTNTNTAKENARNRLQQGQNVRGSFASGASGAGLKGRGVLGAASFRAGRLYGGVTGGAKNFFKGSGGMFGGQFGLGMSFIAPMLAGMIGNKTSREDRAVFNKETGAFDVQDRGMDTASSVLMAGGMGALFGPGGMIAGVTIGFINSMKSATLTIDEQIRVREKEISIIGQNAQAVQNIQNLSNARAQAFAKGDTAQTANLDSMINRTLSGITDDEILRKVSLAAGDENAMAKIQATLQDQMTIATSTQNFGMAIKNKNEKNAGVALGSIIAQSIRSGDIESNTALNTLSDIRSNVAARKRDGTMKSTEELNEIRRKSENRQGLVSGFQSTGATIGGILGFIAGGGFGAITGGAGLAAVGATTAGGAAIGQGVGRFLEVTLAKSSMDELTSMGADEIRMFDKLVQSGAISETAAQAMIAAFREGEMGMDKIAEEAEKAVVSFNKIQRASNNAATALFSLDKKFRQALNRMVVGAEVDKIQNAASIRGERSNANFMSQYMSPSQAASFTGDAESKILQREAANKFSEFNRQSDIDFLRKFKANKTLASFTPRQKESVASTVEQEGLNSIQSMLQTRKFSGTFDLSLSRDQLKDIATLMNVPEPGKTKGQDTVDIMRMNAKVGGNLFSADLSKPEVKSELGNILGVSNEDEISNALIKVQQNIDGLLKGDKLKLKYTSDLDPKDAAQLQEQIKDRELQANILKAQIEAQRKALSIQIAQNRIQAQIQTQLEKLSVGTRNSNLVDDLNMIKDRGRSEAYTSRLKMETGPEYRGFTDDSTENSRQASIRKKIFDEEVRLQKAENLLTLKREAQRLLSEKNLIDALNGLSSKMDTALKQAASEGNEPPQSDRTVDSSPNAPTPQTRQGLPSSSGVGSKYEDEIQKRGAKIDKLKSEHSSVKAMYEGSAGSSVDVLRGNLDSINNARDLLMQQDADYDSGDFVKDGLSALTFGAVDDTRTDQMQEFERKFGNTLRSLETETGRKDIIRNDEGEFRSYEEILKRLNTAAIEVDKQYKQLGSEQIQRLNRLTEIDKEVSGEEKAIEELIRRAKESASQDSDKKITKALEGNVVNLERINLVKSEIANQEIQKAQSQEEVINSLEGTIKGISKESDPLGILADQIEGISTISDQLDEGIKQMIRKYEISEVKAKADNFAQSLKFSDYSSESMQQFRDLSFMDVRAQGSANAFSKGVSQLRRQREFEVAQADPTSTKAEIERSRVQLESVTYGNAGQRMQFAQNIDKMASLRREELMARVQATSSDKDEAASGLKEVVRLEEEMRQLNDSTQKLAEQMQRTTPRDQGAITEITSNMGRGLRLGMGELEEQSEGIYTRLGQQLPFAFRDGLVDAMQAALNGADDLDAKLSQIGISFLQMIQRAFLESAASRVTSAIGGVFGLASGGYVSGGSGVKDDVPAMLMGGEYVIKKSAVEKYGVNFLENLNRGNLQGYSEGGGVNLRIGAPKAAEREEYVDKNQDGNVTRYKVKKGEVGINSALSGYAIANDKQIQKYFSDQEGQFNEDLATKRQEKMRAENKKRRKKAEKNALWGIVLGIVGGALVSKAVDWYQGTDFAKNRAKSRDTKAFNKQYKKEGYYEYTKGKAAFQQSPAQRAGVKRDVKYFQGQGWDASQMSDYLRTVNGGVQHSIQRTGGNSYEVSTGYNKGGQVPSMLTGGEYVMSPSAVKTYGSSMMSSINSGTYSPQSSASQASSPQNNISHGDVNISINVSSSGNTQSNSSTDLNSQEFAKKVKNAVIEVISKEKRVGGTLR